MYSHRKMSDFGQKNTQKRKNNNHTWQNLPPPKGTRIKYHYVDHDDSDQIVDPISLMAATCNF